MAIKKIVHMKFKSEIFIIGRSIHIGHTINILNCYKSILNIYITKICKLIRKKTLNDLYGFKEKKSLKIIILT